MLLKHVRIFAVHVTGLRKLRILIAKSVANNQTSEIFHTVDSVSSLTVDDSSSSESETDIREQASFRECFTSTSWWRGVQPYQVISSVSVLQGNGGC